MKDLLDRQALAERHLPLVRALAVKVAEKLPREIELDDLISYGTTGLMEASQRFDPSRGAAFATYAYYRIRGAIYDGLRRGGYVPRGEYAKIRAAERTDAYLENAAERAAGAGPEARAQTSTADRLREAAGHLAAVTTIFVTSLDALSREGIEDDAATDGYAAAQLAELRPRLRAAMGTLSEKERHLVELFYYKDMTLKEAGEKLGFSKSWASRIHARAVIKIRKFLRAHGIHDF